MGMPKWVCKMGGCCGVLRKASLLRKGKPYVGGRNIFAKISLPEKQEYTKSRFLATTRYHFPISCLIISIDISLPHFVIVIFGATN